MPFNQITGLYDGFIYCIENQINHKKYIGQTIKTVNERFREHCWDSKAYHDDSMAIHRAMRKYGCDNFVISVLKVVSCKTRNELDTELDTQEMAYIKQLNTTIPAGYNVTRGGATKSPRTEKRVFCFSLDGSLIGEFRSMSEAQRVYGISQGKISRAVSHGFSAHGFLWSFTAEPPRHNADKGIKRRVAVSQLAEDGSLIKTYSSGLEAARTLGLQPSLISACCHGRRKSTGGYRWVFAQNKEVDFTCME